MDAVWSHVRNDAAYPITLDAIAAICLHPATKALSPDTGSKSYTSCGGFSPQTRVFPEVRLSVCVFVFVRGATLRGTNVLD